MFVAVLTAVITLAGRVALRFAAEGEGGPAFRASLD
jgi:hypothetical protein